MNLLLGMIVSFSYILFLLLTATYIMRFDNELSRKYVHILSANWWFIAMYYFADNSLMPAIIAFAFIIVNYFSYKFSIFKAIEGEEKRGKGTIYYAIAHFILALVSFPILQQPFIGAFGVLIMGYGDGLAALIGQEIPTIHWYKNKSIAGSVTMFIVSFLISVLLFSHIGYSHTTLASVIIAFVATLAEAFGKSGLDNLSVPLIVLSLATFFLYFI